MHSSSLRAPLRFGIGRLPFQINTRWGLHATLLHHRIQVVQRRKVLPADFVYDEISSTVLSH
jgi:hypothetical protein